MSPSSKATNMLDKLLARSATLHQKLDKLAYPRLPSSRALKLQADPGARRPDTVLESCLSRAKELNDKVDRMTNEFKTPAVHTAAADSRPPEAQKVHVQKQIMRNTAENSPLG